MNFPEASAKTTIRTEDGHKYRFVQEDGTAFVYEFVGRDAPPRKGGWWSKS